MQKRKNEEWWYEERMKRLVYHMMVQQTHDQGITWTTVSKIRANEGQPGYKPLPSSEEKSPSYNDKNLS